MNRATAHAHRDVSSKSMYSANDGDDWPAGDGVDQDFIGQLDRARSGCRESQGRILESLRTNLLVMARSRVRAGDQSQLNPSDLVQSCHLNAISGFSEFQGSTKRELQAWLKTIMFNTLATQRRQRQRPLQPKKLDQSAWGSLLRRMGEFHTDDSTPSSIVIRGE